ncbi:lysophospholipid acyltransferase family protein [Rivibacter subsaxonicus]|uniref:1-acyl-sn-glycerol-3-phosphate acyltransferase n=1 Tax=Rivibacter subsaxonicus TaxID=457575 RepID=A0A4Q7W187_9BURK|nr:lysophospholipid acyltransferase family protein [Rivibacter subsaxonicus]RZU02977.1 1-acyl-sn-glycerol-3-phosphate acyltransferase [Rivibacter subsaxonicus]
MHQRTIFDTPIVNTLLRGFSIGFLKLTGWKVEGQLPPGGYKCVLIAAPHTSNWDLPYTLMVSFVLRLNVYWMGKDTLFKPPFAGVMKWLGGIPVHRDKSSNLVAASAEAIREADGPLALVVSPEGTRSKTNYWKTGFYWIAVGAEVPIVMAYIDYGRKVAGLGPVLVPTGEVEHDMQVVKDFYSTIRGKNARQFEA